MTSALHASQRNASLVANANVRTSSARNRHVDSPSVRASSDSSPTSSAEMIHTGSSLDMARLSRSRTIGPSTSLSLSRSPVATTVYVAGTVMSTV